MKLSPSTLRGRRIALGASAAALCASAVTGGAVALSADAADPAVYSGIVLTVGQTEQSRALGWYTTGSAPEQVQLSKDRSFDDAHRIVNVPAALAANVTNEAKAVAASNGKAYLDSLAANTTYYYRINETGTGNSSPVYSFRTGNFGNNDFDFLFFGDPQIGSSGDPVRDGDGWADTLAVAKALTPNAELLVSGGDQVNTANNENEWKHFLRPDELRQIPWAATIGNHDVGGAGYEQHFALPDTIDRSDALYGDKTKKATTSGGDYWFTYKGVLFIDLNSNAYKAANGSDPAHVEFVRKTIAEHSAGTKHTVLVYHHAIYSPAAHANDSDNIQRRVDFTTEFSNLGVDLVLQGHDHSYSRSYAIKNGVKANPDEQPGATSVVTGPGGVIYVTANSASGSKYYDLTEPDSNKAGYGPDTLTGGDETLGHTRHWANSVENQEHVRTYIKVGVRKDRLVVENVRAGDCAGPNAAVERGNVKWCGPDNGTAPAEPVGSAQDRVDILPKASKSAK